MASNKRARGLDQSTRATLSALDYALEQFETKEERKLDEFTSHEYHAALVAKNVAITHSGALYRLGELIASGKLKKRKVTLAGAQTNLYSKP